MLTKEQFYSLALTFLVVVMVIAWSVLTGSILWGLICTVLGIFVAGIGVGLVNLLEYLLTE